MDYITLDVKRMAVPVSADVLTVLKALAPKASGHVYVYSVLFLTGPDDQSLAERARMNLPHHPVQKTIVEAFAFAGMHGCGEILFYDPDKFTPGSG